MRLAIPEKLYNLAHKAPFPLYVVGGTVRNALANLPPTNDWDICAPADAEQLSALAEQCGMTVNGVYKNTGTVNLTDGERKYEFTSFRTDVYRRGEHAPEKIEFTKSIETDARRRDFKCNAVYYDICAEQIADPLGGVADIKEKCLSTTRSADEVFSEDGLRLMRLARLSAQLGFVPDLECLFGAKFNAALIGKISAERIYTELMQLLHADEKYNRKYAHYDGLKMLVSTDVLNYILPELAAGKDMEQRHDFHDHDVLEHSLRACKYSAPQIRLTALMHDIGKPAAFAAYGKYHGHDVLGEKIARVVYARLKAPKKQAEISCKLIRLHMYDYDCCARENKIRAFIVRNFDVYEPLLLLKQADFSGCKDDLSPSPSVQKWKRIFHEMKEENVPFTLKDLALHGDELDESVPPQARGAVLQKLLQFCAYDGSRNRADILRKESARLAEEFE